MTLRLDAETGPGRAALSFHPDRALTLTVELLDGDGEALDLTGRTFTSTLDDADLAVVNNGSDGLEITLSQTQAQAAAETPTWTLLENLGSDDPEPLLSGTWLRTTRPTASSTATIQAAVEGVTIQATVLSGDIAAHRTETPSSGVHGSHGRRWYTSSTWDGFTEIVVTDDGGSVDLGASGGGVGTATSSDEGGDDRRIYLLDAFPTTTADMELYLDFSLSAAGAQTGLALRADDGEAIIVWNNIFFGVDANLLQGIWEYSGGVLLDTNQHAGSLGAMEQDIISAVGDGSTVTVRTMLPHLLSRTLASAVVADFGPYDSEAVSPTVVDATTFTFEDTEVFDVTTGTWGQRGVALSNPVRRRMAARVVGDEVTFKQWFDGEPEPSWADPLRSLTNVMPATLNDSGGAPPATGGAGLVVAHLGSSGRVVSVNDWAARSLD